MAVGLGYDFRNSLAEAVGPERGLTGGELCKFSPKASRALKKIQREKKKGEHAFLLLPFDRRALQEAQRFAEGWKGRFDDLVVLGVGGSALGTSALFQALRSPFHDLSPEGRGPRLFVLDNVDPELFGAFLERVKLDRALVLAVSKSGATAETMAQFLIVRERMKAQLGEAWGERLAVLTDPEQGPLREIAERENLKAFAVPPPVGGRFSVLSLVGLLPAALCGLDVEGLLAGAAEMEARCRNPAFDENPAMQYALVHYLLHRKRKMPLFVTFAYSERLRGLGEWWRQLVAESLGKRQDLRGRDVFSGPTPLTAVGVTDQHSQVQLYMEGPFDKAFTFLRVGSFSRDLPIPSDFADLEAASSLGGRTLGRLFESERAGTEVALRDARRPSGAILFPEVSAKTVGEYILMMELSVALLGKLYRLNPYDQPGVEAGKIAAREFLKQATTT